MTEEQLNKEAEDFSAGGWVTSHDYYVGLLKGFKAGYRSRDKKFEEMEAVLKEVADHLEDSRWSPEEYLYAKIIKVLG